MKMAMTPITEQKIRDLAERNGLVLVLLFGSQSTGHARSDSDVDIAVLSERHLAETDLVALTNQFAVVFGSDKIDVVGLASASPILARRIADEATVLYDRSGHHFSVFEIAALRKYAESARLFQIRREKLARDFHALSAS